MRLIKPALNGMFKNKKLMLYMIATSLSIGIVISVLYNLYLVGQLYEGKIKNNIVNRVLRVDKRNENISNQDLENLNHFANVELAYQTFIPLQATLNDQYSLSMEYKPKQELPEIISGMDYNNHINQFQIVLPDNIRYRNNEFISFIEYVDRTVTLTIENMKVEAYVCGVYSNLKGNNNFYINEYGKNKMIGYNQKILDKTAAFAIVDDYHHVNQVINNLKEQSYRGYIYHDGGQLDIQLYNTAMMLIATLLILALSLSYVSIGIIIGNIISDEKKDIAILKAIGYRIKDLSKILVHRIGLIMSISLLVGSSISALLSQFVNYIIGAKLAINVENNYKIFLILIVLFYLYTCLITLLSVKINNKKIKRISVIDFLKED